MTAENEPKVWEKPWNTADLINNSTNWSLAGDAGVRFKITIISNIIFKLFFLLT